MFKNTSIKVKIILPIVVLLLIATFSVGIIAITKAKNALMHDSYNRLTAARDSKIAQLNSFFENRKSDLKVIIQSERILNLSNKLNNIYNTLDVKNTENFPVNNDLVIQAKSKYEEYFKKYVNEYNYYDIFIIAKENGQVLYTQAKESDYGENLRYGKLKNSGLAEVWKKVKEKNRLVFVDMKPYGPSNYDPAMFLGAPLYIDGEFTNVIVFQLSDVAINKIMHFRKGYGETQEDYLVGTDMLMRSDSFLDPKGHSLKASFANPSTGKADTKATRNALNGVVNTEIVIDYNGNPVLSAYSPYILGENDVKWSIMSEIDEAEVLIVPNNISLTLLLTIIILTIIISILIYISLTKIILNPLDKLQYGLNNFFKFLNNEINNVVKLEETSNDELGQMSKNINKNISKVQKQLEEDDILLNETREVIKRVKNGWYSQHITSNTSNTSLNTFKDEINEMIISTKDYFVIMNNTLEEYVNNNFKNELKISGIESNGVFEKFITQINALKESITKSLIENKQNGLSLESSSNELLDNVVTLTSSSTSAAAALEETAAALEEVTSTIVNNTQNVIQMASYAQEVTKSSDEGQDLANQTSVAMEDINKEVSSINEAITVIDQIAFQTNILSLNAAVEAATAGEAGKGFAVVAQEVRNLASRSAEAANEIKTLVENATKKASHGKDISSKMIHGYEGLNNNITKTIELIQSVEVASKEQQSGIQQINNAITQLDQQVQQNASVASIVQDVASNTQSIAKDIVNEVNQKEFNGKNDVQKKDIKVQTISIEKNDITSNKSIENIDTNISKNDNKVVNNDSKLEIVTSDIDSDDQWESF